MAIMDNCALQNRERVRIDVSGTVQGIGFRPHIYRLACDLGLGGWVRNTPEGASMEIEGAPEKIEAFRKLLHSSLPPAAAIYSCQEEKISPGNENKFTIISSSFGTKSTVPVLTDLALCQDCLREINDPQDRRYRYPFITCTNCGPRFTIMTGLPYDRPQTTMSGFTLCAKCTEEYANPLNRRFHAQPLACPECGPQLSLLDSSGKVLAEKDEALLKTSEAIRSGFIVALKGLGGFQIICNAHNEVAIQKLRDRKLRPAKPFALMMRDVNEAKNYCYISDVEAELLESPQAPIVIVKAKENNGLARAIAPGNPTLGVMLPYTPLHHLLMGELRVPLIATSGNRGGEPICTAENEALERLNGIVDIFLVHNRPIAHRSDDSIVKVMNGKPVVLRRARGYAPLPLYMANKNDGRSNPVILAGGAHLKNTVALAVGAQIIPSPHIGDLDTPEARDGFDAAVNTLCSLYDAKPEIIAHDKHPEYYSTAVAKSWKGVQKIAVQHHYAHALSCMIDNNLEGPCLAIVWDGAGYGDDGTIWGGEFLRITKDSYERTGHLHPFRLPGGDKAAMEPWRVAVSLLYEAGEPLDCICNLPGISANKIDKIVQMLDKNINSPVTTSMGRLFDGISALKGLCMINTFEAEAAMALEHAAINDTEETYTFDISGNILDWRPAIKEIIQEKPPLAAAKFQNSLAKAAVNMAKNSGERQLLLSGGCFQNSCLLEKVAGLAADEGLEPFWHNRLPPGDGGLSAGQVLAAMKNIIIKGK
jgi:hydrogenase maturation protein HypF